MHRVFGIQVFGHIREIIFFYALRYNGLVVSSLDLEHLPLHQL
jgi:hypothetical protein